MSEALTRLNIRKIIPLLQAWLEEDLGTGDITTMSTVPKQHESEGIIHVKEDGILAGLEVARAVFTLVDPQLNFRSQVQDGQFASKGTIVALVQGNTRSILMGERLSLNLLQRLSGIATRTRQYVQALEGLPVRLVDTRKTTPGHRLLEKYAVRVGGGHNHRFGLYDAVMIKDNHIKGSGGIQQAILSARAAIPHTMKIEVEVENELQLEEAIKSKADIIMLDNMKPEQMKKAVDRIKRELPYVIVEASGSINLDTVKQIAETGVDVISVGRLTYSVPALDISLDLNNKKGDLQ